MKRLPHIFFLCLCTWLFVSDWRANGQPWGFPLDDAWIHLTFGRNLAYGAGFGVNAGEPSGASTSVLWSLWMAVLHLIPRSLGLFAVIACVKGSGVALGLAALSGIRRFLVAAGLSERETVAGLLLTLAAYPLSWAALSGMEVPLTCALCAWAAALQLESSGNPQSGTSRRVAVVLWTLAALARPENVLFLAAALGMMSREEKGSRIPGIVRLAAFSLPFIAIYVYAMLYLCGKPWPTTLEAKMTASALPSLMKSGDWAGIPMAAVSGGAGALSRSAIFLLGENVIALAVFLLAPLCWYFSREGRPGNHQESVSWFAWATLPVQAIFVALIAAPESYTAFHGRYLAHTIWLAVPASFIFALAAWKKYGKNRLIWLAVILGLLAAAERQVDLASAYPLETSNITGLQVRIARWFGECLPRGGPVAANDIGAMGYFSGRRLIDLEGLITPEAVSWNRAGRIDDFIERVKPDYLLIFPYWYPEIVSRLNFFKPLMRFAIEKNVTGGGEELVLFSMPWTRPASASWAPLPLPGIPDDIPLP